MLVEKSIEHTSRLYYDLFVPDNNANQPRPLLIAFHGYEGNKDSMMAMSQKINSENFIIASVQGPNAFFVADESGEPTQRIGFGWMMRYKADETIRLHHQTVLRIIEDTSTAYPVNRNAIFLLAFSQSVALNYRFTFTHPNLIKGVIAVCGGIPGDWNEDKYHDSATDILILAGETDEFYPLERTQKFGPALARRANDVRFQSFSGGHVFPRESLSMIDQWIRKRVTE